MYSKAGNQYILWHRKENFSCFHMRISVPVIVIIGTDQITQILFLQQKQYNFRVMVHDFDMMDVFIAQTAFARTIGYVLILNPHV